MKLHLYLFQRFIPVFLGSLGFFSPVLILVDLLMNLTSYIQNNAAAVDVARVILLYLPKTVWYAMPLGILFAVAYTLSDLYANNELTAIFSSRSPNFFPFFLFRLFSSSLIRISSLLILLISLLVLENMDFFGSLLFSAIYCNNLLCCLFFNVLFFKSGDTKRESIEGEAII